MRPTCLIAGLFLLTSIWIHNDAKKDQHGSIRITMLITLLKAFEWSLNQCDS